MARPRPQSALARDGRHAPRPAGDFAAEQFAEHPERRASLSPPVSAAPFSNAVADCKLPGLATITQLEPIGAVQCEINLMLFDVGLF
jgi:hypothetical protein